MSNEREKITVVALPDQRGRPPLRYRRPFVGLTVREALKELDREEAEGTFPIFLPPARVNGEYVDWLSGRVLKGGDILVVEDP